MPLFARGIPAGTEPKAPLLNPVMLDESAVNVLVFPRVLPGAVSAGVAVVPRLQLNRDLKALVEDARAKENHKDLITRDSRAFIHGVKFI